MGDPAEAEEEERRMKVVVVVVRGQLLPYWLKGGVRRGYKWRGGERESGGDWYCPSFRKKRVGLVTRLRVGDSIISILRFGHATPPS